MTKNSDAILKHIHSIQAGWQKRAEANIEISQALRDLTAERVRVADSQADVHAALQSYAEAIAHW